MMFKRLIVAFVLIVYIYDSAVAQQINTLSLLTDSLIKSDTTKRNDSLMSGNPIILQDSTQPVSAIVALKENGFNKILSNNKYLNSSGKPLSFYQSIRKRESKDFIFYAITFFVLLFAVLRFLYPRYFGNLFRVFFNTSLRQNQLTDQLLQAKLPSLFFNIFFFIIGGWYIYLLLNYFEKLEIYNKWTVLLFCSVGLFIIYSVKFCMLKFTGWITGFKLEVDIYIFIIFMINKIIGICLIPFIIIIAFSENSLVDVALIVSFIFIALMTMMRFLRSYSLLQNRLNISRFHFCLYILGIEIIPLLTIYKLVLIFMSNNL